ncbi:MAG: SIR2 family NAD-dependent protein deacylase [Bacteroidota bacterium]
MSNNCVVITGAGISVESGIQPFRGKDGIWEQNPMTMATFRKFVTDPSAFLTWYYSRFKSCLNAEPNYTHEILASKGIRVITQNIDGLHRKANHPSELLVEIHGCLSEKRKINSTLRSEIVDAQWDKVDQSNLVDSIYSLFNIREDGVVSESNSFRPHVLLFDEVYTDLYEIEKAMKCVLESDTIIFMGTSNSVGITEGILQIGLDKRKNIIVVDPNPAESFRLPGVQIFETTASSFCREYF